MKRTSTIKNMAIAMFLGFPVFLTAQESKAFGVTIPVAPNPKTGMIRCISAEYEKHLQEKEPNRATTVQFESWLEDKIAEQKLQKSGNAVVRIPVVVHVIHNGDAIGSGENIADDQVLSQIQVLNNDFRRLAGSPGFNTDAVGADTEIEFCMAQIDPVGNPTNGIDRRNLGVSSWNMNTLENTLKEETYWDTTKYLNIWVCRFGTNGDLNDKLGYATFPENSGVVGMPPNESDTEHGDGLAIRYEAFGSKNIYEDGDYLDFYNEGRTATHEIGHFFGLRHIWGDGNDGGCNHTDYCDDTPFAAYPNSDCDQVYDSCPNKLGKDMVRNYMDYTIDSCMNIFTQNQKERMLAVIENAPKRASLLTSGVCGLATTAEFEMLRGMSVYPNPAQNELNIFVGNSELPDSYVIYNTLGQTVANVKVSGEASLTVNTSAYTNGIYIIKIFKGNESKTIKFIKN